MPQLILVVLILIIAFYLAVWALMVALLTLPVLLIVWLCAYLVFSNPEVSCQRWARNGSNVQSVIQHQASLSTRDKLKIAAIALAATMPFPYFLLTLHQKAASTADLVGGYALLSVALLICGIGGGKIAYRQCKKCFLAAQTAKQQALSFSLHELDQLARTEKDLIASARLINATSRSLLSEFDAQLLTMGSEVDRNQMQALAKNMCAVAEQWRYGLATALASRTRLDDARMRAKERCQKVKNLDLSETLKELSQECDRFLTTAWPVHVASDYVVAANTLAQDFEKLTVRAEQLFEHLRAGARQQWQQAGSPPPKTAHQTAQSSQNTTARPAHVVLALRILGLGANASLLEAKNNYLKLRGKLHPDRGLDAEEEFREVQDAWKILKRFFSP
jgi:hypothetical protein